jgi:hypothetical protein
LGWKAMDFTPNILNCVLIIFLRKENVAMRNFNQLDRIIKIDTRIAQRATGTPSEFASSLGVSRSHLFRILAYLKDKGAPIGYSRKSRTYFYKEPFRIQSLFAEFMWCSTAQEEN